MTDRPVRVLVADDQTLFRVGLVQLLADDPRVVVVGQAANGAEAVRMCEAIRPDVVVMDLNMPVMGGLEATRKIRAGNGSTQVLILASFAEDDSVVSALREGARGYVLKDSEVEAVVRAILAVQYGDQIISSTVAGRMLDRSASPARSGLHDRLTGREVEVLELIAQGVANKQIARRLGISDKTVRNHLSHIYQKLRISDRSQAVLYAMREGLVPL
jgi:DNA-binding NarL/FixJ family response regulator